MLQENYQRKGAKFSLWACRMVWNGPDANAAIEGVIAQEKPKLIPETNIETLVTQAKAKVDNDVEKCAQIDAARYKLEAFARAAQLKLYTQTALDSLVIDPDNLDVKGLIEKITALKAGKEVLSAQFPPDDPVLTALAEKDVKIKEATQKSAATKTYYEGLLQGWPALPDASGVDKALYVKNLLAYIAKLEVVLANGFEYLDEQEKPALAVIYKKEIKLKRDSLNDPSTGLADFLDADQKASLANMEFAESNMDAAERGGESGHKAGALECWTASMAEQEARDVWNSLAYNSGDPTNSWRPSDFGVPAPTDGQDAWNVNGPWKVLYDQGVVAFQKGMEGFRTAKGTGKWSAATESFRKATALWRELYNQQKMGTADQKKEEAEKVSEANQKKFFDQAKTKYTILKRLVTELDVTEVAKVAAYKVIRDKYAEIRNIGQLDDKVDYTLPPYNILGDLELKLVGFRNDLKSLKETILPGRMDSAMKHIQGQYQSGNSRVDARVVVNDYLGIDNLGINEFQKEILKASGGMVLRGVFERQSSNNLLKRELVVAVNRGGRWEVSRKSHAGANEVSKVISKQDVLAFAKSKAKAAFFQQANQDKEEAIEDFILDMTEWRADLGGERTAKDIYLKILEGEEFDVEGSDYRVKIEGGEVKVFRSPKKSPSDPKEPPLENDRIASAGGGYSTTGRQSIM